MYSQETLLELVELIYAAAGDPAQWSNVLERLARALKGHIATLHHQHLMSMKSSFGANWNMDPQAIAEYTAHYAPLNVWFTTRPELLTEGQVFTNNMLCPDDLLVRTEFYNDWLRPHDMGAAVGAMVFKSGPCTTSLSVFRPINEPAFRETDLQLVRLLMPHLGRALQLHNRIHGLERKGDAAAEALDRLQQGVLLLDAQGRVLLANQAAMKLFASQNALKLTSQGLVAAISSENKQLSALMKGAISAGSGNGLHSGGAMTISLDGLRPPLQVLVTPLRTKTIHLGKDVPVVAVFISDPERKPASNFSVFAQLYGLTPAETRLAAILSCGVSLKDASEKLGVAQSTLRSQLKSIFAKTNTNRQSELVRVLLMTQIRAE